MYGVAFGGAFSSNQLNNIKMNNENQPTVEEVYNEFWKPIVENQDGTLNVEQVKKELHDFHYVMEEVPKVYCHITDNAIGKIMTKASVVTSLADECYERQYKEENELYPDKNNYEFKHEDFVFIEEEGGKHSFYELRYVPEVFAWMLIPFTDNTFKTPKTEPDGKTKAEFLYEVGIDAIQIYEADSEVDSGQ